MGLLTPYIVEKLGTDDFGLWSLTLSFLGFFSLLDLGLGAAVVKYVAECRGARDHERRNQIVSTLFVAYIALALISVLILGALSPFYGELMNLPVQGRDKALMLLWLMAFRLVFLPLPMGMYRSGLHGEQKFYSTNMAQVVSLTLYGVGAYVVLERGGDIIVGVTETMLLHGEQVGLDGLIGSQRAGFGRILIFSRARRAFATGRCEGWQSQGTAQTESQEHGQAGRTHKNFHGFMVTTARTKATGRRPGLGEIAVGEVFSATRRSQAARFA